MFVVGWLFGLFRGPDLRPLGMSLRLEILLHASSWVAFHGCSLELINGGWQCWGLIAVGWRTPTKGRTNKSEAHRATREIAVTLCTHPSMGCSCGSIYSGRSMVLLQ
jgi:hypothetical protein